MGSLSRIPKDKPVLPEKTPPKLKANAKRKRNTPSPNINVKDKRKIFEDNLARKYRIQRNAKEMARERTNAKKERKKKDSPEKEDSIAKLLKEMRDDLKDIKSDMKESKKNMEEMNLKIKKQKDNKSKS